MSYTKYILSKTGLFPKMKPAIGDVLKAAIDVHEIKDITRYGRRYYYVIPANTKLYYLRELFNLFSTNGIILRPHKSKYYNGFVFVVPYRGQKFMQDVAYVNKDKSNFQHVLAEYNESKSESVSVRQKFVNIFSK